MNCIVTVATKSYDHIHLITRKSHENYAIRCKAAYKIISDPGVSAIPFKFPGRPCYIAKPHYVGKLLERFDCVLYVDADCFISRRTPDLFETHQHGKIEVVRHVSGTGGVLQKNDCEFNGGVYLAGSERMDLFSEKVIRDHAEMFCTADSDQLLLGHMIAENDCLNELPTEFNDLMFRTHYDSRQGITEVPEECRGSFIWHAVGYFKNRVEILKSARRIG